MAILETLKDPDPLLRVKSQPVEIYDNDLKEFMYSLLETMYFENGVGIAAIQVGRPIRALIVDVAIKEKTSDEEIIIKRNPFFIINPEIKFLSEEKVILSEACLSILEKEGITRFRGDVERPKSISISYNDLEGQAHELIFNGNDSIYDLWSSRCLQHEIDHLDGILFIDKLHSPLENLECIAEISENLEVNN